MFSYLLGAGVARLNVGTAFVIYILTPLLFVVPVTRQGVARLAPDEETA